MKLTTLKHIRSVRADPVTPGTYTVYSTGSTSVTFLAVRKNNTLVSESSYTADTTAGTITFTSALTASDKVIIDFTDSNCIKAGYEIQLPASKMTLNQGLNASTPNVPASYAPAEGDNLGVSPPPISISGHIKMSHDLIDAFTASTNWTATNGTFAGTTSFLNAATRTVVSFTVTSGSGDSTFYKTWTAESWTNYSYLTFWYYTSDATKGHYVQVRNNTSWLTAQDIKSQLRSNKWVKVYVPLSNYVTSLTQADGIKFYMLDTESAGGETMYVRDIEIVGPTEYEINPIYLKDMTAVSSSLFEIYDEELALGETHGVLRAILTGFNFSKSTDDPNNPVIDYTINFTRSGI